MWREKYHSAPRLRCGPAARLQELQLGSDTTRDTREEPDALVTAIGELAAGVRASQPRKAHVSTTSPLPRTLLSTIAAIALLLASAAAGPAPGRVVAIGDVHGAYGELTAILQEVGLIDGRRAWKQAARQPSCRPAMLSIAGRRCGECLRPADGPPTAGAARRRGRSFPSWGITR